MSHLVESMMYVGEKPWHGLGNYVGDKNITAKDAIKAAGLDWEVKKLETHYNFNGKEMRGLGYDVVRMDNGSTLGHVGEVYVPLQNREAFDFMDAIIGEGRAVYHTAGSLMNGSRIWLLVDMKQEAEITTGDKVRNFILLSNTHDGKQMVDIGLTAVRVVCNNTLQMALNAKEKGEFYRFRHSSKMASKTIEVSKALSAVNEKFEKFVQAGQLLAGEEITRKELDEFLIRLELDRANDREDLPKDKVDAFKRTTKYHELIAAFNRAPGAKEAGSTLWGAVNAVTYHVDHEASSRVTDNFNNVREARLNSAWFNGGADRKTRALSLALEFASKR